MSEKVLRRSRPAVMFPYGCPHCDYEIWVTDKVQNELGLPICPAHNERLVPVDYDPA